ncbi:substrate-binding domain-containing protein [Lacticaseibacillus sp. 53-4]|uniref:substrate-binding domain-containing protein n=1 Tax=Lacticaseibacillus sp. 53-4 TaxID=2799575 RepID=UPI002104D410|nr:substrate-binding domain-containing protein [Lacticaseibacillus sp. 53-4]
MCFNDLMAFGIYQAAQHYGKRVGKDISVVGFDNSPASQVVTPPLTTVDVDHDLWANRVVEEYFRLRNHTSQHNLIRITPRLVERESVKFN